MLLAAVAVAQTTLYKYVGADGKTVYSDKPPPKGTKYETLTPDTKPTGVDLHAGSSSASDVNAAIEARRAKQAERDARVAAAQQNYDAAVAALDAGKDAQEGERHQNAHGASRLSEDYFDRVAELQRKVDEAKAALDAAQKQ
jgi:hypothetical protein